MNKKMIGRFIAQIIFIEGLFMLPALAISFGRGELAAGKGFLLTLAIMLVLGGFLMLICRKAGKLFGAREGMVCVGISWLVLSLSHDVPH